MNGRVDVAIVGAGAAGCVLAYRLAAAGLTVHVVERGHRLDPGGAETVAFGLLRDTTVRRENDITPQRRALRDRSNLIFGTAHPQGGNTMSDDPARGVVDSRFRVHGLAGLSVIDASVLPTNLFANCQATVMALSWVGADKILER